MAVSIGSTAWSFTLYIYIFIVLFSEQEGLNRNEKESKGSLLTISLYALRSEGSTLKAVDWLVNLIHDCI